MNGWNEVEGGEGRQKCLKVSENTGKKPKKI